VAARVLDRVCAEPRGPAAGLAGDAQGRVAEEEEVRGAAQARVAGPGGGAGRPAEQPGAGQRAGADGGARGSMPRVAAWPRRRRRKETEKVA